MLIRWPVFCMTILLTFGHNVIYADAHLDVPGYVSNSRARGAILFMNYCSGCHSLRYLSWSRMLSDLNLNEHSPMQITPRLLLSLPQLAQTWPKVAMTPEDATNWFGKPPPDLSLISRQRGKTWVLAYLQGFYPDHAQRFGVNNHQFPNTMMPNVLESLPNDQRAELANIAYFLAYAAEPAVLIRNRLGWFVLGFLLILTLLYWLRIRIWPKNI